MTTTTYTVIHHTEAEWNTLNDRIATVETKTSWPIGSVFIGASKTDPNTLLGFGTWNLLGEDTLASTAVYIWQRTA